MLHRYIDPVGRSKRGLNFECYFVLPCGQKQLAAQSIRIVRGETQSAFENARLVLSFVVMQVQAVVHEFAWIDDGVLAAG